MPSSMKRGSAGFTGSDPRGDEMALVPADGAGTAPKRRGLRHAGWCEGGVSRALRGDQADEMMAGPSRPFATGAFRPAVVFMSRITLETCSIAPLHGPKLRLKPASAQA